MISYLDTSTLVKLYVDEPKSDEARLLVNEAEVVATSRVAYVEAVASFVRRLAPRTLTAAYRQARHSLDQDWPSYLVIEVTDDVTKLAAQIAQKYRLRGFDCLHLASAVFLKKRLNRPIVFSSADAKLNAAARKEGLDIA